MTIYFVNNLNYNLNPSQLAKWFESVGELRDFAICTFNNNNFNGKCVIQYANDQASRRAINELDRTYLNGRLVIFHFYEPSRINSKVKKFGKYFLKNIYSIKLNYWSEVITEFRINFLRIPNIFLSE